MEYKHRPYVCERIHFLRIVLSDDKINTKLNNCLKFSTEKEREIFKLYFYQGKTYKDIGKEYNLSRERIRQIVTRALRKVSTLWKK